MVLHSYVQKVFVINNSPVICFVSVTYSVTFSNISSEATRLIVDGIFSPGKPLVVPLT